MLARSHAYVETTAQQCCGHAAVLRRLANNKDACKLGGRKLHWYGAWAIGGLIRHRTAHITALDLELSAGRKAVAEVGEAERPQRPPALLQALTDRRYRCDGLFNIEPALLRELDGSADLVVLGESSIRKQPHHLPANVGVGAGRGRCGSLLPARLLSARLF